MTKLSRAGSEQFLNTLRSRPVIYEIWRLIRFFVVGLAWGGPFALLAFVNNNPGVSEYPVLAHLLETLQEPSFYVMPIFVIIGVALVAWLSRDVPPFNSASVMAVFLAFIGGMFGFMLASQSFDFMNFILIGLTEYLPLLGVIVTVASFWACRRWLAIFWLIGWITVVAVFWFGSRHTTPFADDLGSGLGVAFSFAVCVIVSLIASSIAFLVTSVRSKRQWERGKALNKPMGSS